MTFRPWHTIDTAPKDGTMIELKSDRHPGEQKIMFWSGCHWEGQEFLPMGPRATFWEPTDPPTHWRPIG